MLKIRQLREKPRPSRVIGHCYFCVDINSQNMDTYHTMPKRDLLICKQCEWRWLQATENPPTRCPNGKCRSMRWNSKKSEWRVIKSNPAKPTRRIKALA